MRTCHRHYPGRFDRACSLVPLRRRRPSLCNSQVGSCNYFFGACSAFTRVMACTLTESPSDPLHRKLRQLRCLRCRFDCYRVERTSSRAGVTPAEVQRLSRRTVTPIDDYTSRPECTHGAIRETFWRLSIDQRYGDLLVLVDWPSAILANRGKLPSALIFPLTPPNNTTRLFNQFT